MKNKKTLLGVAAAAVITSTLLLTPSTGEGTYQLRENKSASSEAAIGGAFDYYSQVRMNIETGTVNKEDWLRSKQEAESASVSREDIGWLDNGPDNIGGRTRAILIDKADDNHIFVGSVSGGLFSSVNRGNTWAKVNGFSENLAISSMCMTDNGNIYVATGHSAEQVGGTTAGYDSGANGNGVYESTDGGVTFTQITGTANYTYVNEVVAKGNDVYIAAQAGLKVLSGGTISNAPDISGASKALSISPDGTLIVAAGSSNKTWVSTDGGASFTDVSGSAIQGGIPQSAGRIEYAISHERMANGNYSIFGSLANSNLLGVHKSIDNGATWTQIAPANNGAPGSFAPFNSGGSGQGTYDNIITVVPGNPESILLGGINIHAKSATGNWEQRSNGFFGIFSPLFVHSDQHEMQWDSQGRLWVGNDGGCFFSDDNGNEYHQANRNLNITQYYKIGFSAHGDVIGGAQDNGTSANYHDNATYRQHKAVGGGDGFGCAMSFINRNILFTTVYYGALNRSGDRGVTSTAFQASNIPASYGTPGDLQNGLGSFNTCVELYENPNDLNSTDSVVNIPSQGYAAGEVIQVSSLTSQVNIDYTTPTAITFDDTLNFDPSETTQDTVVIHDATGTAYNVNQSVYSFVFGGPVISVGDTLLVSGTIVPVGSIEPLADNNHYWGTNVNEPGEIIDMLQNEVLYDVAWDTIKVQDPYQSWFAFGLGAGEGVWLTRNALRLSSSHDGFLLAGGGTGNDVVMTGQVSTMEFSGDGNHLYIGTTAGRLYRLSGLDDIYSPNPDISNAAGNLKDTLLAYDNGHQSTTFEQIGTFGAFVTNIACDKQDPDHVVVTLGNYGGTGGKIRESNDATGVAPSFSNIEGDLPFSSGTPFYSVIIDRNDPDLILAGCDFGVWQTKNGGVNWDNVSGEFGNTPVWDMGQNWRTFNEGCYVPGEIYIGTHGRGIWSTDEYLGVEEVQDNLDEDTFKTDLMVYPNPVNDFGTVAFELFETSDVTVQVYNLAGMLVQSMQESAMNEGMNSISLETAELPKGTYFVRLTAGDMIKTTKFIKH